NDVLDGGLGTRDTIEVNGSLLGDDAIVVSSPDGMHARIERTNLVPFVIVGTGFENITIQTWGGADMVTVGGFGTLHLTALTANLGDGNDQWRGATATVPLLVNGGNGDDLIRGGTGRDVLNGGPGQDTADYSQATSGINGRLNGSVTSLGTRGNSDKLAEF